MFDVHIVKHQDIYRKLKHWGSFNMTTKLLIIGGVAGGAAAGARPRRLDEGAEIIIF